eukprot:g4784.t1
MENMFLEKTVKYHKRSRNPKLKFLDSEFVGRTATWDGPFGERRLLFCDHATSSRPLRFVEKYIFGRVLPYYVNAETESTATGRYTSTSLQNARDEVRRFANADDSYAVLFVGNGSTSAINRLFHIINLAERKDLCIVLGPYEHDSTHLAAMTTCEDVSKIQVKSNGELDVEHLKFILDDCLQRGKKPVGVFSVVSNTTGIVTDTNEITKIVHDFEGICCWDYATAAPYKSIDVNGKNELYSKDAVFFSPHKLPGGVSTPGILIAKQNLFVNRVPGDIGGGAASYVTQKTYALKRVIEEREEGGTPNTVGKIRTSLILALTDFLPYSEIEVRSFSISEQIRTALRGTLNLELLGNPTLSSMPIFSFVVKYNSETKLHYHYVTALLNDLFGIQSRGGSMGVGSYSQALLKMSDSETESFFSFIEAAGQKNGQAVEEIMKPGYSRISVMYSIKQKNVEFIISALQFVAKSGWKFLPAYKYNARTGFWNFDSNAISYGWHKSAICRRNKFYRQRQKQCIRFAEDLASGINKHWFREDRLQGKETLSAKAIGKKWFLTPLEAFRDL